MTQSGSGPGWTSQERHIEMLFGKTPRNTLPRSLALMITVAPLLLASLSAHAERERERERGTKGHGGQRDHQEKRNFSRGGGDSGFRSNTPASTPGPRESASKERYNSSQTVRPNAASAVTPQRPTPVPRKETSRYDRGTTTSGSSPTLQMAPTPQSGRSTYRDPSGSSTSTFRAEPATRSSPIGRQGTSTRRAPAPTVELHRAAPGFRPAPNVTVHNHYWSRDSRYGHARFYPRSGYSVSALPRGHRSYYYSGRPYYFYSGIWYSPAPYGFVVTRPPIGMLLPVLPLYYSIVWFGNTRYYYANDIYYLPAAGGYAVVEAPVGTATRYEEITQADSNDSGPFSEGTWYYCQASAAYYPYVNECSEGWLPVPAVPGSFTGAVSSIPKDSWFWCDTSQAYYPYVTECGQPWRVVPSAPQSN